MPSKIECKKGRGRYFRTSEIKEKNRKASLGHQLSDETKRKIGEKSKGRKPMLDKRHSAETKKKMSLARQGKGNGNWKGGRTLTVRLFRKSRQYQQWRRVILKRDNYICQVGNCGKKSNLVHHKLSVKDYPDLRLIIKNGMVVCKEHHNQIHKKRSWSHVK